jgi:hypothetical protein
MKKAFFVAMVLICAFATSIAQSKTPAAVASAFNLKFPNATKVKWDKENAHNYEASFEWRGVSYSANFSDTGEWLETETPITFNQLPEKVQTAFNTLHKGVTPNAISKIETSRQRTIYEFEMKQGAKTIEIFYNADGTEARG